MEITISGYWPWVFLVLGVLNLLVMLLLLSTVSTILRISPSDTWLASLRDSAEMMSKRVHAFDDLKKQLEHMTQYVYELKVHLADPVAERKERAKFHEMVHGRLDHDERELDEIDE